MGWAVGGRMCISRNDGKMRLGVVSLSMASVYYRAHRIFSTLCPEKEVTNLELSHCVWENAGSNLSSKIDSRRFS